MNCDDFYDRLQRALDDRVRPESDRELVRHSKQCEPCRGQLDAWQRVSAVLTPTSPAMQADVSAHASPPDPLAQPISPAQPRRTSRGALIGLCAMAVAAMWAMAMFRHQEGNHSAPSEASPSAVESLVTASPVPSPSRPRSTSPSAATVAAVQQPDVDPERWWQEVQGGDWVGRTMPTVRSVQEGVAPIGRTLMRAMTILTIGGETHTS